MGLRSLHLKRKVTKINEALPESAFFMATKYYMSTQGQFYIGYSLVDITPTGVVRGREQDSVDRNQQRNWETVLQCIGLRTQPHCIQLPVENIVRELTALNFGEFYTGQNQKVWTWLWATESADIYDLPNQPLGGLSKDLEQVPIITGLTETAKFMLPIFYPYGAIKNIYVERYAV